MATRKYKSHATSRRFKERGLGAQASERRITEQTTRNIESIKLAKIQSKEASQNFISGLSDKLRFEEGVLAEKHKLEGKVRQHKFAALQKKAETDVARLQGEAKQKKEYADWIKDLAPKFAKNIATLGGNLWDLSDQIRGKAEWLKAIENGSVDQLNDGVANAHWSLQRNATNDSIQLSEEGAIEGSNALIDGTINFSTRWAQNQFANYIINNKKGIIAEITAKFDHEDTRIHEFDREGKVTSSEKPLYGEKTAVEMLDFGARQILKQAGISDRSEAGVRIINALNGWGTEAAYNFNLVNQAEATKERIKKARAHFINIPNDGSEISNKERQVAFEAFVTSIRNGFYSTNGKINDPRKGEVMSWGDAVITAIKYDADRSVGSLKGLNSPDDIYDYLGDLQSINTGKEKPVLISEKFKRRIDEEVIPHIQTLIDNKVDKYNKKLKANGGQELLKLQNVLKQRTKDGDEFTEQERLKEIVRISELTEIDETSRASMYKLLDYDSSKIPDTAKYIDYRSSMESGNEFRAQSILLTIPKDKRGALTKDIEVFNRVRKENGVGWQGYIDSSTTTFHARVKSKYKGNLLLTTDSADKALIFFQGRVLDKVRSGMTLSEANESELKLLDEGLSGKGGDDHPYNTIKGRLEPKEFTMFMGNDARTYAAVDLYLQGRERSDTKWDEIKDSNLLELNWETDFQVALMNPNVKTKIDRVNTLLGNARIVSPDVKESIRKELEAYYVLGPGGSTAKKDLGDIIPITVKKAATLLGMDHVTAMNIVLKNTFGTTTKDGQEVAKYSITADGQSASVILNNGKPVEDRDIPGTNMINACKAQNILPITELNRYTIDFNVDANTAWSKVKGIDFTTDEFGSFQTSDFSKFVLEGGYRLNDFPFKSEFLDSCGFGVVQSFQNKVKGI